MHLLIFLRDLVLTRRMQWYKKPQFLKTHLDRCLSYLVAGSNYHLFPATTGNRTQAACVGGICLRRQTIVPPTLAFMYMLHIQ